MVKFPMSSGEQPLAMSDLVRAVRAELKVRQAEARSIVGLIFREIMEAVARGDRVELRGIGTLKKRASNRRWGRDFKAGSPLRVNPGGRVSFKVSRKLRSILRNAGHGRPN